MARQRNVQRNALIVEMKDVKKMSFREIAKVFGVDVRAVWEVYGREKGTMGVDRRKKKGVELIHSS